MRSQMKSASPTPRESTPMNLEDILTPDQLAERLRVKVTWVYEKNRRRGQYTGDPMPCLRLGRYLRFYGRTSARGCAIRGTIIGVERILTSNDRDFAAYSDAEAVHPRRGSLAQLIASGGELLNTKARPNRIRTACGEAEYLLPWVLFECIRVLARQLFSEGS